MHEFEALMKQFRGDYVQFGDDSAHDIKCEKKILAVMEDSQVRWIQYAKYALGMKENLLSIR
jgi:hypothetical protein